MPSASFLASAPLMSALGQKQTYALQQKSLFDRVVAGTKKLPGAVYFRS
jgi:hypothetical protein